MSGWLGRTFKGLWSHSTEDLAALCAANPEFPDASIPRIACDAASEAFHRAAGTLTPAVQEALARLRAGAPLVRVAHQPILLPYMGVLGQFLFLTNLVGALQGQHRRSAVPIYQVVDYDAITERRLRVAYYPTISARNGFLALSTDRPKNSRETVQRAVAKPTPGRVSEFVAGITTIVREDIAILRRQVRISSDDSTLYDRIRAIRDDMWEAQAAAKSHAEFSAFWLSRLINVRWGLPVVFIPAYEALRDAAEHVAYLVDRYDEACDAAPTAAEQLRHAGFEIDETLLPRRDVAPVWSLCPACNVRGTIVRRGTSTAIWRSVCSECGRLDELRENSPRLASLVREGRLIPRVLFQDLLDIVAYQAVGGVGYIGNAAHMMLSALIAGALRLRVFPERLWRPRGIYFGTAEIRSALESQRVGTAAARDLVLSGRASGPYYLVSQGFEGLRDAWLAHLATPNGLGSVLRSEQPNGLPAEVVDHLEAGL